MAENMRLDKLLSHLQFGTRAEVKKMIRGKRVEIDHVIVRDPGFAVSPDAFITVDGVHVAQTTSVYYVLNKPAGVITATKDANQKTVLDLIASADQRPGLYPIGRLDKDTTGLLVLTNDGPLGHTLLAPRQHVDKTYRVTLRDPLTADMAAQIEAGITLTDFTSAPASVRQEATDPRVGLITIHEGKFHEVKRLFRAVGNRVLALERVAMGELQLPVDLPRGQYRSLSEKELALLRQAEIKPGK